MSEEERNVDPFSVLCRGCLNQSQNMKNMYEWGLSQDFFTFADVPVERSERLSEMICSSCEAYLASCKEFRSLCQKSNKILRDSIQMSKNLANTQEYNDSEQLTNMFEEIIGNTLTIHISTTDMTSKILLPCPHKCGAGYQKKKDLLLHTRKNHSADQDFSIELKYFCPLQNCRYNWENQRTKYFTERKFLNQHLNKVHRSKDLECEICNRKFSTAGEMKRHDCNSVYICGVCDTKYQTNERLLVHLMRQHPDLHAQYKSDRKKKNTEITSPIATSVSETKKHKNNEDLFCDSPKRSFATQTLLPDIKNDVTLPMWNTGKSEEAERNTIETQTVFEDLLSLRSQNSEEDSMFFETVSLSDIQTQTFPIEFGLSRKETITSETQTTEERDILQDFCIKETQTCVCHYDSPKINLKLFDSVNSSPGVTSTETQTLDYSIFNVKSDLLLGMSSIETQTNLGNDVLDKM